MGGHDDGSEIEKQLAGLGLKPDRPMGEEKIELWPDMAQAVDLFADLLSQWNIGPGGVVGLRYEAMPVLMEAHGILTDARRDMIRDLKNMEYGAIEVMNGQ